MRVPKLSQRSPGKVLYWLCLLVFCWAHPGLAQPEGEADQAGIGVSLLSREDGEPLSYFLYQLSAGAQAEDRVQISNFSSQPQKLVIYVTDGQNTADGGLSGPLQGELNQQFGNWVQLNEKEITLQPKEEKTVVVRLNMPANLETRDYFGFIFIQPVAEDTHKSGSGPGKVNFAIKVQTRYGVTLVNRVPGEDRQEVNFVPPQKEVQKGQLVLSFGVKNAGNRYLKPKGSWKLVDASGQVVLSRPTDTWGYLLPGSSLKWDVPLQTNRPLARGKYHLLLDSTFGTPEVTRQADFPIDLP